jgi:hypothetical protein
MSNTLKSKGGAIVPSTDVGNRTILGSDGKVFTDLSGTVARVENQRLTANGVIDFTLPRSFEENGYSMWEFFIVGEQINLPSAPAGYEYIIDSFCHFRAKGSGNSTTVLSFKCNIIYDNAQSINYDDDSQRDSFIPSGISFINLDNNESTRLLLGTNTSTKPRLKLKFGYPELSPLANNIELYEFAFNATFTLIKTANVIRTIVATPFGNS